MKSKILPIFCSVLLSFSKIFFIPAATLENIGMAKLLIALNNILDISQKIKGSAVTE